MGRSDLSSGSRGRSAEPSPCPSPVQRLIFPSPPDSTRNPTDGPGSGGGRKRLREAGPGTAAAPTARRGSAAANLPRPWSELADLPAELASDGPSDFLGRAVTVKAAAVDTASFKLKKKFFDLRIFIEDGSGPRQMVILGQGLTSGIMGGFSAGELYAMKKSDKAEALAIIDSGARRIRSFEGVMTLEWAAPPLDPNASKLVLTATGLRSPEAARDAAPLLKLARGLLSNTD
mmetsp:Transcript_18197/g.41612  ORF Transcript_18197/g.41612 Transcript_18197/m.41612 type:complete len:232 (-) Transcript_18197:243-938(-)